MAHRDSVKRSTVVGSNAAKRRSTNVQIRKDKRQEEFMAKRRRATPEGALLLGHNSVESICLKLKKNETNDVELIRLIRILRSLLSAMEDSPINIAMDLNIIDILMILLEKKGGNAEMQIEIVWCLTNLASGNHCHTRKVLPTCPYLVQFLSSASEHLAEQAAWALGNVAADCQEFRVRLQENGVIAPMTNLLKHKSPLVVRTAAWALSNLVRGVDTSALPFVQAGICPLLIHHVTRDETCVQLECWWVLTFLTAREDDCTENLINCGLCEAVFSAFQASDEQQMVPILRVLGNLMSGKEEWGSRMLQQGEILTQLLNVLSNPAHRSFIKEAAWVISNIAAHSPQQVDTLVKLGFLPCLVEHLRKGDFEIRKEVAFCLWNIIYDGRYLEITVNPSSMEGLLQLTTVPDQGVVRLALQFIDIVLRKHPQGVALVESLGGIDVLDNLQYSEEQGMDHRLSNWASRLVDEFYGENYDEAINSNSLPVHDIVEGVLRLDEHPLAPAGRGTHMTKPAWTQNIQ